MRFTKSFIVTAIMIFVVAMTASAQNTKSFFEGKWNITITGLPQGDSKSIVEFKTNDKGELTGTMTSADGKGKPTIFTHIENKGDNITAHFTGGGYDVYLYLEKVDNDNIEGSMMDRFDITGSRVK